MLLVLFGRAWCFLIQAGSLLTAVWTGRVADLATGLAGSGQVSISDFLIEIWVNFTIASLEKGKTYLYSNSFAWETLDVIVHV